MKKGQEIKVKRWIPYSYASKYRESPCGGMGGFFNFMEKGQRWNDYVSLFHKRAIPYINAIRDSVLANNSRITGEDHQYSDNGVPLFSDNTVGLFTYRAWGDIMAAIWSEEEDKDYSYMDFYMQRG